MYKKKLHVTTCYSPLLSCPCSYCKKAQRLIINQSLSFSFFFYFYFFTFTLPPLKTINSLIIA